MSISFEKRELRRKIKAKIELLAEDYKDRANKKIFDYVISLPEYKHASEIYAYMPLNGEADTLALIKKAWFDNKRTALPVCCDGKNMDFYYFNDFNMLNIGIYGILSPDINKCGRINKCDNSLLIIPGLSFDLNGIRLGHGKGYYDNYLSLVNIKTIGLCYECLVEKELPHEDFDKKVDILVTEKCIRFF